MAPPPPSPPLPPLAPGNSLRYRVTIENKVSEYSGIGVATWYQVWEAAYAPWPEDDKHTISSRPTSEFVDNPDTPGTQKEGTMATTIETNSREQWNLIINSWTGGDFPPCRCEKALGVSEEICSKYITAELIAEAAIHCMCKKIAYTDEEGHVVFTMAGLNCVNKIESDYFEVADSSDESSDESSESDES